MLKHYTVHFAGCKGVQNYYRFTVSSVSDELGHFALSSVFCLFVELRMTPYV